MNKAQFTVSDDKKTLTVTRKFNAPVKKVWQAWTTQELLEQWWAPKPWKAETKTFEFKVGGHWHYAMVGPKGEKHWGWMGYHKIDPEKMFQGEDFFCDDQGEPNKDLPNVDWTNQFADQGETTTVTITSVYNSPKDLETVMEMGMKEGLTMTLDQLEDLITK